MSRVRIVAMHLLVLVLVVVVDGVGWLQWHAMLWGQVQSSLYYVAAYVLWG